MAGGTGDIAFRLAERGAEVTVADINQEMLDVGLERAIERGIDGLVWSRQNAEDAGLSRPHVRRLHDRLRHPQRDPYRPRRSPRRTACSSSAGGSSASSSRPPNGRASSEAYDLYSHKLVPQHRQGDRARRGQLSLPDRIDPPLPADARVRGDDPRGRVRARPRSSRSWAGWWRSIRGGRSDRDRPATHIWRLLKWGRTLARHGALRGIERDLNTPAAGAPAGPRRALRHASSRACPTMPPRSRRSARRRSSSARRSPPGPTSSASEAARNLLSLQDSLPPVPFDADPRRDRAQLRAAARRRVRRDRPGAGRLGLDRAGPQGRDQRRQDRGDQGAAPGHPRDASRATSTPTNGPRRISRRSAARRAGCARG